MFVLNDYINATIDDSCLKELPLGGFTILELKRTENDSFVEHMSKTA